MNTTGKKVLKSLGSGLLAVGCSVGTTYLLPESPVKMFTTVMLGLMFGVVASMYWSLVWLYD